MQGKFELFKDKAGEYRFRLKAPNGQIIIASEGYKVRSSAMNGIESVRKNSQNPDRFVGKKTRSGKLSFERDRPALRDQLSRWSGDRS